VLNKGSYKLQFRKKEEGKTSYLIDKTCVDVPTNYALDGLKLSVGYCGWPAIVDRIPLDKNGN
jgi:hypothetical protein